AIALLMKPPRSPESRPSARAKALSMVPSPFRSQPSVRDARLSAAITIAISSRQLASQPSKGVVLRSSQTSPGADGGTSGPSPQLATASQVSLQPSEPWHTSPAATSRTPLPQVSSDLQPDRQPSPERLLPSSPGSAPSTGPSPQ